MKNNRLEILIAGDFCPIGRTQQAILEGKSKKMIQGIKKHLDSADISVVNLEAPLSSAGKPIVKTGPNLISDPGCVDFLVESGFTLINTANNHIADYGDEAFFETMNILDSNNLRHVGSGINLSEALKEEVFSIKGEKIAFIAYAENEYTIAGIDKAGAAPIDFTENIRQIKQASKNNDITIVMVHGGNEYNPIPSPAMKKRYRGYVDAGASAVVAMHTHCPQGYEIYNGVPVVYSLGNFLFDTPYPDKAYKEDDFWWKGYMIKLVFVNGNQVEAKAIPIDFGPDGTCLTEITGYDENKFAEYMKYISAVLKDDDEAGKYWKAWCMMKGPWWVGHFNKLKYPFDLNDREQLLPALALRNGHSCEAHNEIITTFMKLIAHGESEDHEPYIKRIEQLQKGLLP